MNGYDFGQEWLFGIRRMETLDGGIRGDQGRRSRVARSSSEERDSLLILQDLIYQLVNCSITFQIFAKFHGERGLSGASLSKKRADTQLA